MGRTPWPMYLWPGLPQIAREGSWAALAMAIGFAALVNLALMATLLWSELFTPEVRNSVWMAVLTIWGGSAVVSYRWDRRYAARRDAGPAEDAFTEARDHYLKGNWFESEHVLHGLLGENPRDLDAGLMLAALLRRAGRPDEAQRELDRLKRLDGSEKWEPEINRELELLHEARSESAPESVQETDTAASEPPEAIADAA